MDLSIVIPAYNEIESLPVLISEIKTVLGQKWQYEIIVVDDGSTDGTKQLIQQKYSNESNIQVLSFLNNHGKALALDEGFKKAQGKYVITMDADLQDDPVEIPRFIEKLGQGADLVSGWKKKRKDPIIGKNLPSKLFNFITRLVSGIKLRDFNCGFKGYQNYVVKSLILYGDRHRYIPLIAFWSGFRKIEEISVNHRVRQYGKSKYGLNRFTNGFLDLISITFLNKYSSRPLHIFGLVGLFFCFLGSGILGYFFYEWILKGSLSLRPMLISGFIIFLLGVQIISLGLLGEMIVHYSEFSSRKKQRNIKK